MTPDRVIVGLTVFFMGVTGFLFGHMNAPIGLLLVAAFATISPLVWDIE